MAICYVGLKLAREISLYSLRQWIKEYIYIYIVCSDLNLLHNIILKYLLFTCLGNQRCPGHSYLIPPFTCTWSQITILAIFPNKTKLRTFPELSRVPKQNLWQVGPGVSKLWSDKQTNRDYNFIDIKKLGQRYLTLFGTGVENQGILFPRSHS